MTQVNIRAIIEHSSYEMKRALEDTLARVLPEVSVDRNQFYKEFCKAVGRKTSTWTTVNDNYVETRCKHCGERT